MRVLLATDFSAYAETARALVASLPLPAGSTIRVVHTVEPLPMVSAFAPVAVTAIAEGAESAARSELRTVAASLAAPDRTVDVALGFGRPADVVIEEASGFHPDLIVMGSRGRGALASALLGSVSAEVIDRAPAPVLIARKDRIETVILADDGSSSAGLGASVVAAPYLRGAKVVVVSVVDAPYPLAVGDPTGTAALAAVRAYEETLPVLRETHANIVRDRVHALAASGIIATSEVREGDAGQQLLDAAQAHGADLIVVGSRGETGLRRLVLGSVARGVLFGATCSVLVAHARVDQRLPANGEIALATR